MPQTTKDFSTALRPVESGADCLRVQAHLTMPQQNLADSIRSELKVYLHVGMTCRGCSSPPCLDCFAGNQLYAKQRPGCAANDTSVGCVPPETAMGYKGKHWPTTEITGINEMHIFLIGDWGGLDGSLDTAENRPEMIAYDWGRQPGPSVFPRSRWNKPHTERLCVLESQWENFKPFGLIH